MTAAPPIRYPLTIYVDGACPLCAAEMATLLGRDAGRRLRAIDCSDGALDDACRAAGLGTADLLAAIHARDADGCWLVGVDVFVAAYDAAGLSTASRIFGHRLLRPIWDRLYPWIARHRNGLSRLGVQHLFRLLPRRAKPVVDCERSACRAVAGSGRTCRATTRPDDVPGFPESMPAIGSGPRNR